MNVLSWKLLRELWARKGALSSLCLITAMGICFFTALSSVMRDLDGARADFYRSSRLPDFSLTCKRAPDWAVRAIAQVPNVRAARGRVQVPVRVELGEPLIGSALSLPYPRRAVIGDISMRRGTYFSGRSDDEVLLNDSFARARGILPGHRLNVVIAGSLYRLLVVGTVMSPEFVYVLPSGGGLAPDPARTPVLWLQERFLQRAATLDGAYNEVVGMLKDTRPQAVRQTLKQAERRLEHYGVLLAIPQAEQSSVNFLANELNELRVNSVFLPSICLGIVALVLHVVMGRTVAAQRTVVGTLRALGYTPSELWRHYLGYGVAVGLLGGVLGLAAAVQLQGMLVRRYAEFFEIPRLQAHGYPDLLMLGLVLSLMFACAGAAAGIRGPLRLEPAEAMRPAPPESGRNIWLESIPWLWSRLGFRTRMVLRSVFRNPFRSLVTLGASLIATALLVETLCMFNAIEYLIDFSFRRTAHQDITVSLREPQNALAQAEIARLPSVAWAENQFTLPCDLSNGPVSKRLAITGLGSGSVLLTPLDAQGNRVAVPPAGLLLARKLADILRVEPGQTLRLKPLLGRRQDVEVQVAGVVDTYLGLSAYAHRQYLSSLLGESDVTNSVALKTHSPRTSPELLAELRRRPAVLGVDVRRDALAQLNRVLNQNIGSSLAILVVFAGGLAFGSVLNTALVSLGEREREVGTLRVLGYTEMEVWSIFAAESYLVNGAGILLGLPGGVWFANAIAQAYNTELFRLPVIVTPWTLATAGAVMLGFVSLAQIVMYRLVRGLRWLEVFKVRE